MPNTVEERKAMFEQFEELLDKHPPPMYPGLRPGKQEERYEGVDIFGGENKKNEGRLWGFMRRLF